MKNILITIAVVLLVGCEESKESAPLAEAEPVDAAAKLEPANAKAPSISISKAVDSGNLEAVKQHIAAGANLNKKDVGGFSLLHWAADYGHKEIAELLIANGANVRAKSGGVSTPLHWASSGDHKEIVELLIANGADVNAIIVSGRKQGKTPLGLAIVNRKAETADLLRKHGGKTGEELKATGN